MSLQKPRFKKWRLPSRRSALKAIPRCTMTYRFQSCLEVEDTFEDEETDVHSALSCSYNKTDPTFLSVFGGFQHQVSSNESAEIRRLPCGYVGVWELDEDEAFVEHVHFTYSGVPYPVFTPCGNFISCVGNNSHSHVSLPGYTLSDDDEKVFETIEVNCKNGNLSGRMKCICIDVKYAFTVTDMKLAGRIEDYVLSVWHVQEPFLLRHAWQKRLVDVFTSEVIEEDVFIVCCSFSPDGEHVAILLSNGIFSQINLTEKVCCFESNLKKSTGVESGHIPNFSHQPLFKSSLVSFGHENNCYSIDTTSNRIQRIVQMDHTIKVTHIVYSKDGELFSVSSLPQGDVFIHMGRGKYLLLYTLHVLPCIPAPFKANCSDFSPTSEDMAVVYNNGQIRIWQLPRVINLKLMCRICILKRWSGDEIDCLQLPNQIKNFLRFKPIF